MNGGSGAFLLFVVFLVLKLTGFIAWSWWWVTAPLWAGLALTLGFVLLAFVFAVLATALGFKAKPKSTRTAFDQYANQFTNKRSNNQ